MSLTQRRINQIIFRNFPSPALWATSPTRGEVIILSSSPLMKEVILTTLKYVKNLPLPLWVRSPKGRVRGPQYLQNPPLQREADY